MPRETSSDKTRNEPVQLPAIYEVPPALDAIDVAAELLGFARARPQHRGAMVTAARALLDALGDESPPNAAMVKSVTRGSGKNRVVRKARKPRAARNGAALEVGEKGAEQMAPAGGDVTVITAADEERIEYAGQVVELTTQQAKLAALLARGMPNPIGREFLATKCFPGAAKDSGLNQLSTLTSSLQRALAPIGLAVNTLRGVGVQLKAAEAE